MKYHCLGAIGNFECLCALPNLADRNIGGRGKRSHGEGWSSFKL